MLPEQKDPDERGLIATITKNSDLLQKGYKEQIEYVLPVAYHTPECLEDVARSQHCDTCPVENEKRSRRVNRDGLLTQLAHFMENRDCDLNPKAARGAPRVKKPKMNPELNGAFALDEIICDVYMSLDRIFEQGERDRLWLSEKTNYIFAGLARQSIYILEAGRPDLVREIARLTDKWVAMAQRALNQKVSDAMFGDTVCGNCNGGLAAPARIEGESAVVRCIGSPSTPPCGETYPASEWLSLYENGRRSAA